MMIKTIKEKGLEFDTVYIDFDQYTHDCQNLDQIIDGWMPQEYYESLFKGLKRVEYYFSSTKVIEY